MAITQCLTCSEFQSSASWINHWGLIGLNDLGTENNNATFQLTTDNTTRQIAYVDLFQGAYNESKKSKLHSVMTSITSSSILRRMFQRSTVRSTDRIITVGRQTHSRVLVASLNQLRTTLIILTNDCIGRQVYSKQYTTRPYS